LLHDVQLHDTAKDLRWVTRYIPIVQADFMYMMNIMS